ncbi:hypothetical protein CLF_106071 [Clonorchis sinensis]|uniref:Uncharacterized protein n=1 Tax=Clonorchis sinensis TaxID=79923 RepID=G7YPM6_CLOSI|nr:hypothetical protein CLF_106071 [Clonorchis sinensis]
MWTMKIAWRMNGDESKRAMLSAFRTVCPVHLTRLNEHWISSRSADLIAARKAIPATSDYDGARRSLKHRIISSLKSVRTLMDFEGPRDKEGLLNRFRTPPESHSSSAILDKPYCTLHRLFVLKFNQGIPVHKSLISSNSKIDFNS